MISSKKKTVAAFLVAASLLVASVASTRLTASEDDKTMESLHSLTVDENASSGGLHVACILYMQSG